MKKHAFIYANILFFLFLAPLNNFAQCFSAPNGQNPSTTQTISTCNGSYQTFASNCSNGEFTALNVTAGNYYSFKSSKASDFITISDANGTLSYTSGVGTVTWTATLTTIVRFYTHKNSACASDTKRKKRMASCTLPVTCAAPGSINSSGITNTTATVSWAAASPSPGTGYTYEIRTSGTGGSGTTGLTTSGSTASSITSINISGLTAATVYTAYVRSNCGTSYSSYIAGSTFTTTNTVSNPVPAFSHIVVVIGENTSANSVFGNSSAPYINALANAGAKFTNSFAISHPSQPNYIQLYSGSNQGVTDDSYITTKYTTSNLGRELINAGKSYTTYSDGLPSVGYDGSSYLKYVRKHNPAANWMGTGTNQISTTTNQPFTAFPADFNTLPAVAFVVPDLCHDGHDVCAPLNNSVLQFDSWVQSNLDAYKQWCINNNSLLIITYDEDDYSSSNKIATVFYGANVAPGIYSQTVNHYNVLRTMEDANSLSVHAGAAASATTIDYCWSVAANVPAVLSSAKKEKVIANEMSVYPNPANDKINITLNAVTASAGINWEIADVSGKKMKTGTTPYFIKAGTLNLPVDNLKNGIYQVRITDGLHVWVSKFVIAR